MAGEDHVTDVFEIPGMLLLTHIPYWALVVALVIMVRRLRQRLEASLADMEALAATPEAHDA